MGPSPEILAGVSLVRNTCPCWIYPWTRTEVHLAEDVEKLQNYFHDFLGLYHSSTGDSSCTDHLMIERFGPRQTQVPETGNRPQLGQSV